MLSQKRREQIRNMAKAATFILGPETTYPFNLDALLEKFEIKLLEADMEEVFPGKNVSGILVVDGEDRKIYINSAHADTRNKFTVAHELGHFFLHDALLKEKGKIVSFRSNSEFSNSEYEKEADLFAAELLMPKERMFELIQKNKSNNNIRFLSEYFGVSPIAMSRRIAELNAES